MGKFRPNRYFGSNDDTPTGQENRVASRLGGKRVRGSGASMYSKGDVRDVPGGDIGFLVECKQTIHASLSIKWAWLCKITAEANAVQSEPAVSIEIRGGKDDLLVDRDWVMIPARVFRKLKDN